MKTTLILIIFFLLMNVIFPNIKAGSSYAEKTIKIKCTEMTCDGCKRSITKSINTLKGITKLDINLESKIITVEFDESSTDTQSILNAVIEAGYDAVLMD
jgi:copper chaperone CopZ